MKINIQGSDFNVEILSMVGNKGQVKVNGEVYDVRIDDGFVSQPVTQSYTTAAPAAIPAAPSTPVAQVIAAPEATTSPVTQDTSNLPQGNFKFLSPLPGIILSIDVNVGDKVSLGQNLIVLEAMKMENSITSDVEGVVTAIKAAKGDCVMEGDVLIEIAK